MKKSTVFVILLFLFIRLIQAQAPVYASNNFTLVGLISPETFTNSYGDKYSGCWGWYQANKNKEYAIAGSASGTYWVDVTNPATPTVSAYKAGKITTTVWREIKTYQNYCYVISDDGGPNSFQIFDMQYLPDSVSKVYDGVNYFRRGHTLWVDGNKLYVAGITYSNNTTGTMNVYSLATPSAPVLMRALKNDHPFITYVHDMLPVDDTVYASCGNQGLYIFKFNSSAPTPSFTLLNSLTSYPSSGFNHSTQLTPNKKTLIMTDEVPPKLAFKVISVSNNTNLAVMATAKQFSNTTPHNPFVASNSLCYMSSYRDGLQLYNISSAASPSLIGFFDTFYQGGGNNNNWSGDDYSGQWGCYPYFPSKNVFALDQRNGIFMLKSHLYQNPVPNFSIPTGTCAGAALTPVNSSTSSTTYTWNFSGGNPATSTLSAPTVSYSSPGVYTITLMAGNNTTTTAIQTKTVFISGASIISSFTNATCGSCPDGSASVSVSGGLAPYTYSWAPTGGSSASASGLLPGCYTISVKDANNCTSSAQICLNNTPTNLSKQNLQDIQVFPNPASTELFLNLSSFNATDITVKLINTLGKTVSSIKINNSVSKIPVSNLVSGFYVIHIQANNKNFYTNFIKN
ncbi:MAG: choice-of-anchor B family protein [Bacteroidota bacterium]